MDSNVLFDYNPETHFVGISPMGYMKPLNAPSSSLRPVLSAPFDSSKKAFDLTPQYSPVVYRIPTAFVNHVDHKVMYAYEKLLF
jgi:hypothetical protein